MKKVFSLFMLASACIFTLVSCNKGETDTQNVDETHKVHFIINANNPTTKTYLDNQLDGTYTVGWHNGDELAVFIGDIDGNTTSVPYTFPNTAAKGATATFEGDANIPDGSGTFKSFYPSSAFEKGYADGTVGVNTGDKNNNYAQFPTCYSFDKNYDILVGQQCNYEAESSVVVIDDMKFARMLCVLKVNLKGTYAADEAISSLRLDAPVTLSGRVKLDPASYTIPEWTVSKKYVLANINEADGKVIINDDLQNSVYLLVNPTTIASGSEITFTISSDHYDIEKSVTLTKDIVFPQGGIYVINLTIAESNCTPKSVFTTKIYDKVTDAASLNIAETIIVHRDVENTPAYYFIPNAKGAKPASLAIAGKSGVTLAGDLSTITISSADVTNMTWSFDGGDANFSITSTADATLGMGATDANDGLTVQTSQKGSTWSFAVHDTHGWDIKHDGVSRYLAVNTSTNVRTYSNNTTNQNAPFFIYQLRDGKMASGIVWSSTSANATITSSGTTFTPPTLTNTHSLPIAYSSSNTDVATIDPNSGDITIVGAGSTVIQAYFAGDATYKAIKKRYTLTVTDSRDNCVAPSFSPAAGAVTANTEVTISSTTTGSTIYYTTNGDTPEVGGATTTAGTSGAASATVTINEAKTIKAIAVKSPSHKNSTVSTAEYTIAGEFVPVTIWDDDFSNVSGSSALSSLNGSKTGFTSAYAISTVYASTGAVRLATNNNAGSIQTPAFAALTETSKVSVTIQMAGYNAKTPTVSYSVTGGGTLSKTSYSIAAGSGQSDAKNVSSWNTDTFTITGATSSTKLTVSTASGKQLFINSINIVTTE